MTPVYEPVDSPRRMTWAQAASMGLLVAALLFAIAMGAAAA